MLAASAVLCSTHSVDTSPEPSDQGEQGRAQLSEQQCALVGSERAHRSEVARTMVTACLTTKCHRDVPVPSPSTG